MGLTLNDYRLAARALVQQDETQKVDALANDMWIMREHIPLDTLSTYDSMVVRLASVGMTAQILESMARQPRYRGERFTPATLETGEPVVFDAKSGLVSIFRLIETTHEVATFLNKRPRLANQYAWSKKPDA